MLSLVLVPVEGFNVSRQFVVERFSFLELVFPDGCREQQVLFAGVTTHQESRSGLDVSNSRTPMPFRCKRAVSASRLAVPASISKMSCRLSAMVPVVFTPSQSSQITDAVGFRW